MSGPARRTVLRGGLVFDGTGAEPVAADVVITDGRITEVGAGLGGDADTLLDVSGALVAPGLIDCHVHTIFDGMDMARLQARPFSMEFFAAIGTLGTLLDSGVTTVRDAGGADLGIKTAVAQGLVRGPRMTISISALSQTGGHVDGWNVHGDLQRLFVPHPGRPDCVVDGVEGMRLRVRELIRAGADTIKVCASGGVMSTRDDPRHAQFSYDELAVCVEEAAATGRSVIAHAHGAAGIKQALRAGVRSIEHGVFVDDEAIELFLETGAWLVPTLLAPVALVEAIDAGMVVAPEVEAKARSIAATHLDSVARAHAAGVRIAMGTDSGVFAHGATPRELTWMTRAGLTPWQALHAATGSAAGLLELPDVGRVAPGCVADLVVLDGASRAGDFEAFATDLRLVLQGGEVVRAR
jgi:imidazolonepropionase-like amidohydrolase